MTYEERDAVAKELLNQSFFRDFLIMSDEFLLALGMAINCETPNEQNLLQVIMAYLEQELQIRYDKDVAQEMAFEYQFRSYMNYGEMPDYSDQYSAKPEDLMQKGNDHAS